MKVFCIFIQNKLHGMKICFTFVPTNSETKRNKTNLTKKTNYGKC